MTLVHSFLFIFYFVFFCFHIFWIWYFCIFCTLYFRKFGFAFSFVFCIFAIGFVLLCLCFYFFVITLYVYLVLFLFIFHYVQTCTLHCFVFLHSFKNRTLSFCIFAVYWYPLHLGQHQTQHFRQHPEITHSSHFGHLLWATRKISLLGQHGKHHFSYLIT